MASCAIILNENWKKKISLNLAAALLVFTLLQIACFGALAERFQSPAVSLVGLVIVGGIVVPALGRLESRLHAAAETLSDAEMAARFGFWRTMLWIGALALPAATGLCVYGLFRLIA